MRILPDDLREILKEPIDKLVDERGLLKLLKKEEYIVSVGDQVTYTLLKHNIEPVFCIVDFKIKRGPSPSDIKNMIQSFGKKNVVIRNPPGCISDDLWNAIETAYDDLEKGSLLIVVEGEEDLAALPAIFLAPKDVTIIYGLPNKGVVVVKSTEENKRKVKEILDKM
ncbi:MAG: DUF359 domain-containing protein [Thermoplasmatales archaeon]|nr:DUF359 domain-containing protein [Thermoplasmatales archaeon]